MMDKCWLVVIIAMLRRVGCVMLLRWGTDGHLRRRYSPWECYGLVIYHRKAEYVYFFTSLSKVNYDGQFGKTLTFCHNVPIIKDLKKSSMTFHPGDQSNQMITEINQSTWQALTFHWKIYGNYLILYIANLHINTCFFLIEIYNWVYTCDFITYYWTKINKFNLKRS